MHCPGIMKDLNLWFEYPHFEQTRQNAKWFAEAQSMAKEIYKIIPPEKRGQFKVWYPLRNKAQQLVRQEMEREVIMELLKKEFLQEVV